MTVDFKKLKRDKLVDLFRRVVANPGRLEEVAEAIAADWMPILRIDEHGKAEVLIGEAAKL
jgi:hypothetical protein